MDETNQKDGSAAKCSKCYLQKPTTEHHSECDLLSPVEMRLPNHGHGYGHQVQVSQNVHNHDEDCLDVRDGRHASICRIVSGRAWNGKVSLRIVSRTARRRVDLPLVIKRYAFQECNQHRSNVGRRHYHEGPFDHPFWSFHSFPGLFCGQFLSKLARIRLQPTSIVRSRWSSTPSTTRSEWHIESAQ